MAAGIDPNGLVYLRMIPTWLGNRFGSIALRCVGTPFEGQAGIGKVVVDISCFRGLDVLKSVNCH